MKMMQVKRLLVIPSYEHFSEVKVNVNDLYNNNMYTLYIITILTVVSTKTHAQFHDQHIHNVIVILH